MTREGHCEQRCQQLSCTRIWAWQPVIASQQPCWCRVGGDVMLMVISVPSEVEHDSPASSSA